MKTQSIIKSIIFSLILVLFSSNVNANSIVKDSWWETAWKTALVDAGGALGGAGSVGSLIGAGAATPLGGAAIVGGALLGGASASIGYAGAAGPSSSGYGSLPATFGENYYDFIGTEHNILLFEYLKSKKISKQQSFYDFSKRYLKSEYEVSLKYLSSDYFTKQDKEVKNLKSTEDIFNFVISKLPESVDKRYLTSFLKQISNTSNIEDFLNISKKYENSFFNKSDLKENDIIIMKTFFSTLRHSTYYWNYKLRDCNRCIIDIEKMLKPTPTFPTKKTIPNTKINKSTRKESKQN
ncbi:hypothetical protein [Olleya marilimosa]|uniref:hypothetical protein n=1 Tax=Olleya marilimosa TaxID=272164 RepID=UPI00047F9F15|nr:hypothetical protein [Olleya marilimosa]